MIISIERHVNVRNDWRGKWGVRLRGKCTSLFEVRTEVESRRKFLPWLQCGKCMIARVINILLLNIYWAVARNECLLWNGDILCSTQINTAWKQTPHYFFYSSYCHYFFFIVLLCFILLLRLHLSFEYIWEIIRE